jgi:hypothetical protein
MKALIDQRFTVQYISSWEGTPLKPVYSTYPDSARVCEVSDNDFPVSEPLFWVDCDPSVVADQFYYDTQQASIFPVVNEPKP